MQPDFRAIFRPAWIGFPLGAFIMGWLAFGIMPWHYQNPGNWLAYIVIFLLLLDWWDTIYWKYIRSTREVDYAAYYDAHFIKLGNGFMHKDDYANLTTEEIKAIEENAAAEREAKEKAKEEAAAEEAKRTGRSRN